MNKSFVHGFLAGWITILLAIFLLNNLIIPLLHKDDRIACLEDASLIADEGNSKLAKEACFRKYPSFN